MFALAMMLRLSRKTCIITYMVHVPRLIEITNPDESKQILSEDSFALLNAPLILLGEPGAGKTETAKMLSERDGYFRVSADVLATGAPLDPVGTNIPVIDGLDETLGTGNEMPLLSILRRLDQCNVPAFVLTCRAADWADVQNERLVENWFGVTPVVGRLQPLNDEQIVAMVDVFGTHDEGGQAFLDEALSRNVLDLARNPQALWLLLSAIKEHGWPSTKTELYQSACESFAGEQNEIHRSLHASRPATESILSAAGFVCAQLILSGKRGVHVDGREDEFFVRLAELASDTIAPVAIEAAVSTLLFRASGVSTVEPYHRTIAEYLSAKWMVGQLQSDTLSLRRLETLLDRSGHVPRPLRGVHAWLATLNPTETPRLVERDPYGCFRYGDVAQYSVEQTRHLIVQLQNLASIDPHFRREDWDGQVGNGLSRPECRDEIVELIRNSDVPYNLSTVILESLKGTELAASIKDDLRFVVLDSAITYVSRYRALEALEFASPDEDWVELATNLILDGDHSSARIAVSIAIDHCSRFSGKEIAEITNAYDIANASRAVHMVFGIAYRLLPKMSQEQKAAALSVYAEFLPAQPTNVSKHIRKTEERIFDTLKSYLEQGAQVTAERLWYWLRRVSRYQPSLRDWHTFSAQYFSERDDLRRQVQSIALANSEPDEGRTINFQLRNVSEGLMLQSSDLSYHLEHLVARESQLDDFVDRWRAFAEWIFANVGNMGEAEAVARRQAETYPELQAIVDEIAQRPAPSWEREEEERRREWELETERQNRERFQSFASVRAELRQGTHVPALYDVARAFMGLFSDLDEIDDPVVRIERHVGYENLESALDGLVAACHRDDLPTPRAISEHAANEDKVYFLAKVALVGCAFVRLRGDDLAALPRATLLTALAASDWGLHSDENRMLGGLDDALMGVLFDDPMVIEQFVRDTIEPALFAGKEYVSGLYQLFENSEYAGLAGQLSVEWLARSEEMSAQVLRRVLSAALVRAERDALSDLIAAKLEADSWPSMGHRSAWNTCAFLADFDRFSTEASDFMTENIDRLNDLRSMMAENTGVQVLSLTVAQLTFVIEHFAASYPNLETSSGGRVSDSDVLARFIDACISKLGDIHTQEAQDQMERLATEIDLANHTDHAMHVLAEQKHSIAEADWSQLSLSDIRRVLLGGIPRTVEDLQALIVDEIATLQSRLRDGSFNDIRTYWDNETPHLENYCRDRIASQLEPHLERYGVRVHSEGTMPSDTRCDLLCTIGEIDLPIEIKGQWHTQVWNAATEQLEVNYSRYYRAKGFGVYLVLWFGDVPNYNPPGIRAIGNIESADAMVRLLKERSSKPISPKTRVFVMDLSRTAAAAESEMS